MCSLLFLVLHIHNKCYAATLQQNTLALGLDIHIKFFVKLNWGIIMNYKHVPSTYNFLLFPVTVCMHMSTILP